MSYNPSPALGQALAAASLPTVLPLTQINGAVATESTLSTLNGKVTAVNTGAVAVSSSALPSGAATSALQGGGLPAALGAGGGVKIDGSGTAVPVSAASLPLPSGASTSANQSTGNASLATVAATMTPVASIDMSSCPIVGFQFVNTAGWFMGAQTFQTGSGVITMLFDKNSTDPDPTTGDRPLLQSATAVSGTLSNFSSNVWGVQGVPLTRGGRIAYSSTSNTYTPIATTAAVGTVFKRL